MVRGQVYLARTQLMHPELLTQSYPLYVDDALESQSQSGVQISVNHMTKLFMGPNSRLVIQNPSDSDHAAVTLDRGTVRVAIISDPEQAFAMEIFAAGARITVREGEATIWALEDAEEFSIPGPHQRTIQTVGVINHGTRGDVAFDGMEQTVMIPPGFLSVSAPNSAPVQAVAIDAAKPFATHIIQMTDIERRPNGTAAVPTSFQPIAARLAEPVVTRDCGKKQAKAIGAQSNTERTAVMSSDCR